MSTPQHQGSKRTTIEGASEAHLLPSFEYCQSFPFSCFQNIGIPTGPPSNALSEFLKIVRDVDAEDLSEQAPGITARKKVFALLDKLAEITGATLPQEAFPVLNMHKLHMLSSLALTDSNTRLAFARSVCAVNLQLKNLRPRAKMFVEKMFRCCSVPEKQILCNDILIPFAEQQKRGGKLIPHQLGKQDKHRSAQQLLSCCLGSCRTLHELKKLVQNLGAHRLTSVGTYRVQNIISLIELRNVMSNRTPQKIELNKNSSRTQMKQQLEDYTHHLEICKIVLDSQPGMKDSSPRARYRAILRRNQEVIKLYQERIDKTEEQSAAQKKRTLREMREAINLLPEKIEVELDFVLSLEIKPKDSESLEIFQWGEKELSFIRSLKRLHLERFLIGAHRFYRIILDKKAASENDDDIDGSRLNTGPIEMLLDTQSTEGNANPEAFHDGLLHEFGHQIKWGKHSLSIDKEFQQLSELIEKSEPVINLKDFFHLTHWHLITTAQWKPGDGGFSVDVIIQQDGKDKTVNYPLDQPVLHNEKEVIFFRNLVSIDKLGQLFYRPYGVTYTNTYNSFTDPFEHWADSFVDYFRHVEKLIDRDPWLFVYFDQQFGFYQRLTNQGKATHRKLLEKLPELNNDTVFRRYAGIP